MTVRLLHQTDVMTFCAWNDVTVLLLRGNPDVAMLEALAKGYVAQIADHKKIYAFTCVDLTKMPKLGQAEKDAVKRVTEQTQDSTVAVQWIEGQGVVAATARAMLVGLNLLSRSRVKTVTTEAAAIDYVLAQAKPAKWTRGDLETVISETRMIAKPHH